MHGSSLPEIDAKAIRELGSDLIYSLHVDPVASIQHVDNSDLPHFSVDEKGLVTANLRGGRLNRTSQLLLAKYSIPVPPDHDIAQSGTAHPLARYVIDYLQAQVINKTLAHLNNNDITIVDVGGKYVSNYRLLYYCLMRRLDPMTHFPINYIPRFEHPTQQQ